MDDTYKSVRESLDQLSLESGVVPLQTLLEEQVKQFEEKYSIKASLSWDRRVTVPNGDTLQIFRIVQEAMSNAQKHSNATDVSISMSKTSRGLQLAVKDNGSGFDVPERPSPGGDRDGHLGLSVMRERAESLGGSLSVASAPGAGSGLTLFVPDAFRRNLPWKR